MVYRFYCMALFHSQTRRHMIIDLLYYVLFLLEEINNYYQSLVIDITSFHSVKITFLFVLDMH